jgi:curved DNA-binding protein CbpA
MTHYDLIGVDRKATYQEIKVAYKRLALEVHQDRHPDEADVYTVKFQRLLEADLKGDTPC